MKKDVLFVVDERCMGGVSVLLNDILHLIDISNLNVDVLILHNRGNMLENLPKEVNIIYGTPYFSTIDLTLKQVLKSKNIKKIIRKFITVFDLKTGFVKHKIINERKKMNLKHYDYEIAFKDGYTAIFTAFSDSNIKYHWIQYDYSINNPNSKYDRLMRNVLSKFDKIISVSDGIKNDFNKIYNMGDNVEIISNLVDSQRIVDASLESNDQFLDKTKTNLICVGRLNNQHKGFDRLINVIAKLDSENLFKDCIVRIYGNGPDEEIIQNQINSLNLQDKIILCGRTSNPYKYYKGNDLFILPSRYEAFGLVIVEALTLGVPVLATANSATNKLINPQYGLVVENTDEGIYLGLKKLLLNKSMLADYKNNLQNYQYCNTDIIKQIEELFKKEDEIK